MTSADANNPASNKASRTGNIRSPRGTRDFYPDEMLRRRYIESMWREVATRHGFEEIDGPRFEHLDLYTIKSGDGIVSELFSFQREGGDDIYALRPEFTPTLARMVAAKANALPKPVKWFSVGPYFRAERPQRGRLREFLQWNVDIVGDDAPDADAEVIACCVDFLRSLGLTPEDVKIKLSNRDVVAKFMRETGVDDAHEPTAFALLDRIDKMDKDEISTKAKQIGWDIAGFLDRTQAKDVAAKYLHGQETVSPGSRLAEVCSQLETFGLAPWLDVDFGVVRGLAYYTGTVFEVHEVSGLDRAIAGGGRYDHLVELVGGPATPAIGFAMGDVVLANVLDDREVMPTAATLRDRFGFSPDVFVIPGASDEAAALVPAIVAALRAEGLHVRHSYRATRNTGKLLGEASRAGARLALFVEGPIAMSVKPLRDDTDDVKQYLSAIAAARGWSLRDH